ncbi:3664_t:CDS:1, partial [Paraglomus occultum]
MSYQLTISGISQWLLLQRRYSEKQGTDIRLNLNTTEVNEAQLK